MKKVLIFTLSILLLANIVAAATKPAKIATTVGVIKSIDMNSQSFVMEKAGLMKFLYAFIGLFGSKKSTDITVITITETEFKKKTAEGAASGAFTDLAVGQRVQVKGRYMKELTTGKTSFKAVSVFILTPVQAALKACQTDADCAWCGTNCLKKDLNRVCIQISPPEGYDCQCINGICKKVSTLTTIDKTCQEVCIAQGFSGGTCKTWAVSPQGLKKAGCRKTEKSVGYTKDCTLQRLEEGGIIGEIIGIGKTCCCSKRPIRTTD